MSIQHAPEPTKEFVEAVTFKEPRIKPQFSLNALTILRKRYLQAGETPEGMLERVSMGNPDYYNMMARLDFLPNSPTLFNLGTGKGTASACFVFDIEDSMDHIMHVATKIASVQKWGGGVGMNFSNLRPKGAEVKGTGNHAGGPVAFLKMYNAIGDCITQSGKRNAAQMAILNVYHADIEEWITCKQEDPDSLSTFNMSIEIPDQFMNLVTKGKGNSSDRDIETFNKITEAAWKTGDPGVYFVDRAERDNPTPHLGPLAGVNPCGESPLNDNESCNLGSINLANFVVREKWYAFDASRLRETVRTAVRYLNAVLDNNQFPHLDITKAAHETRKIGLGVMGWADALATMNIHYDTQRAVEMGSNVMRLIQETAHDESEKMCFEIRETEKETGMYPSWVKGCPIGRNATVTCIAPTGTISILANCSSGIEPHYSLEWERTMGDGTILKEKANTGDFVPKTANEIEIEWHIKHQAAFQKHTDLAVSKTINLPNSATVEDVRKAYIMMWEMGCKGGTVFRDGCRDTQVLKDTSKALKTMKISIPAGLGHLGTDILENINTNGRKKMPTDVQTIRHKMKIGGEMEAYLFGGKYEDGKVGELFITATKEGTTIAGLLDAIAILTSIALQRGETPEALARKFAGTRFEPAGMTGNPNIPTATSPVDYIFRWLDKEFSSGNGHDGVNSGLLCVECNGPTKLVGGCVTCTDVECAYSRCG